MNKTFISVRCFVSTKKIQNTGGFLARETVLEISYIWGNAKVTQTIIC